MDLQRAQGRVFEPCSFTVGDRLSVPAYARALGTDDPLLCSSRAARGAGLAGRPVVPMMFAFFQTLDPERLTGELGFVWGRTLSAGMEFVAGAPITDDDEVVGQTRVEAVWERTGRDDTVRQFLRLATEYRTVAGEFVCVWRIVFIEKKDGGLDPDLPPAPAEGPSTSLEETIGRRRTSPAPKAVPGETLPSHRPPVLERLVLARMSVAIDNPDPLHLDDELARKAGLPGVVGQGSLVAGALYEPVRRWAGIDRVVSGSVSQRRPVLLGAALRADGQVETVESSGQADLAICRTVLVDGSGEAVAEANFRVVL